MKLSDKSKSELLELVESCRRRIAELELAETRRALAERELRSSENRYRKLVELFPDAVLVHSDGKIVFVNERGAELLGAQRPEDLHGREFLDCVHPDFREIAAERIRWITEKGHEAPFIEGKLAGPGGEEITVETAGIPFEYEGMPAVLNIIRDITERKRLAREIEENERRYRTIVESLREGIGIVDPDETCIFANQALCDIVGYDRDELTGRNLSGIVAEDDLPRILEETQKRREGKTSRYEVTIMRKDGEPRTCRVSVVPWIDESGEYLGAIASILDVTDKKRAEEALKESERKYRELVESANSIIMRIDPKGNLTFFNEFAQRFFGFGEEEILGMNIVGTIVPETESSGKDLKKLISDICAGPDRYQINENENITKEGKRVFVSWTNKAIYSADGEFEGVLCVGNDITERKLAEDRLAYLSMHDALTGLNNRAYFEEKLKIVRPPVGIIVCDVDGLKLVNDALGHDMGDRLLAAAADIMKQWFRADDVLARIGGDEFAALVRLGDPDVIERIVRRIRRGVETFNEENPAAPLSISIGFACGGGREMSLQDIFKEADNSMYREKLHHGKSARSSFVKAILGTLEARGILADTDSLRLQDMSEALGRAVGLPERSLSDLRLLAKFHDIGLIGIGDEILFKPKQLTVEERKEMKRHCEVGHRIAKTVPELAPVAELIMKHHEWWNGEGYPLGLKKEEIPIECRIVAIVEAYEAMMSDRPYRSAMKHEDAAAELKRCAGTQFDPSLVAAFLGMIRTR